MRWHNSEPHMRAWRKCSEPLLPDLAGLGDGFLTTPGHYSNRRLEGTMTRTFQHCGKTNLPIPGLAFSIMDETDPEFEKLIHNSRHLIEPKSRYIDKHLQNFSKIIWIFFKYICKNAIVFSVISTFLFIFIGNIYHNFVRT